MTLAVIVGFSRIFSGATYTVPLVVVGGTTHVWLAAARRRGVHLGLAAVGTALGFVVLVTWLVFHQTAWLGLPTSATAEAARSSVLTSWHAFQTVVAPTAPQSGFMLAAALAVCFAVFLADWAAFRLWSPIEALVPTLTLAGFTIFVGSSRGQILTTVLYVAAAMAFVLEHRVAQRERTTTWLANQVERGSSWLVHVGAAAIIVSVLAGAIVAPHLPGAGQPGLVHWHGNQGGGGDRVTISPLVDIKSKLTGPDADVSLFTVNSPRPAYWRLTSLDTFTGQIWESSGKYDSASGHLSGTLPQGVPEPAKQATLNQTFTISRLAELWLPAAYVPVAVQPLAFRARYQASSSTLIVDTNLSDSDSLTYRVRSVEPDYTPSELRGADRTIPTAIRSQDLAVPGLSASAAQTAREVTASARTPYDKAMALQTYFRSSGGFTYDATVDYQNDNHAMDLFLRLKRGFCQQFAGTFAALARSVGLPTRVAVGFTPGVQDTGVAGQYDVKGAQAHAWPEVYLGQYGWVPFEPTPGRGAPNEVRYLGVTPEQNTGRGDGPGGSTPVTQPPSTVASLPAGPTTTQAPQTASGPTRSTNGAGLDLAAWSGVIGLALLVLALVYLVAVPSLLALRRRRRRERARDPGARVRLAWLESEEALAQLGQSRRDDETAREFAARAGRRLPTQSPRLMALASAADAALFGADAIDDGDARTAEQTTETVQTIVTDQVPRWRRLAGQLDARRLRRTTRRALEAVPHALTGVAEVVAQPRGPHRLGDLVHPGLAHTAGVALEGERRDQHDHEAEEGQDEADAQGEDQDSQTGDEAQYRPLQVAVGVGVDGGVGDVTRQTRVALVELGLDLAEDSLLVLGKRHLLHPLSVGPGRGDRRPDGSGDPGLHLSTGAACQQRAEWISDRFSTDGRVALSLRVIGCRTGQSPGSVDVPGGTVRSGPQGASASWRTRTWPAWASVAGPMADRPNRARMASTASVASSQPTDPSSSRLNWRAVPSLSPLTLTPIRRTPGDGSTAASNCFASRMMSGVESVASGRVVERVMVWKSLKRTLRVMVRPASPCRRSRLPTASARRTTSRCRVSWVWWSWTKVSSWPTDLRGRAGSTARSSMPLASAWRWRPAAEPSAEVTSSTGMSASSAMVDTPSRLRRVSVAGPTPHSADTGNGQRKSITSSAATTFTPRPGRGPSTDTCGLAVSDASLATNLDGPIPTEQVMPTSSCTRRRISVAIFVGAPWSRRADRTSRNASSSEIGSTSGVNEVKISITWPLTSP